MFVGRRLSWASCSVILQDQKRPQTRQVSRQRTRVPGEPLVLRRERLLPTAQVAQGRRSSEPHRSIPQTSALRGKPAVPNPAPRLYLDELPRMGHPSTSMAHVRRGSRRAQPASVRRERRVAPGRNRRACARAQLTQTAFPSVSDGALERVIPLRPLNRYRAEFLNRQVALILAQEIQQALVIGGHVKELSDSLVAAVRQI